MLVPMHLLTSTVSFPGIAALPSVLGTVLAIAAPDCWANRRLLSLTPLVFVGRISYSWYLWHWPLLAFLRIIVGGSLPPSATALAITLSLAAAVLTYLVVEQPFRRSSAAPIPLLCRYAAFSTAFIAAFAVVYVSHGVSRRYPVLNEKEISLIADEQDPCMADYGVDEPNLSSRCYPALDPRPSVVLWGDSHAGALATALRRESNTEGYKFIQLGKSACLPLKAAALFLREHPSVASECMHFNNKVLGLISADPRIQIVIMAGRWESPFLENNTNPLISNLVLERERPSPAAIRTTFVDSLSSAILNLQDSGKRVIVIDDVPNFDFDALYRFRTSRIPARRFIGSFLGLDVGYQGMAPAAFVAASNTSSSLLKQVAGRTAGSELIEPRTMLCNSQNFCKFMDGDRLLYRDGGHLTPDGAQYALRDFHLPHS